MGKRKKYLVKNLLVAARQLHVQSWKQSYLPSIDEWAYKVWYVTLMNKITVYKQVCEGKKCSQEQFVKSWGPFIGYWKRLRSKEQVK